ncbi:MAG: hypothetical protein MHM6MM_003591 [Cercozoa sp. M6MM]
MAARQVDSHALCVDIESAAQLQERNPNVFCVISRSKNANLVVYEANIGPDGELVRDEPVLVYWLKIEPSYRQANRRKGKSDDRQELSVLEWRMAYGISHQWHHDACEISFVALPERKCMLRIVEGRPRAVSLADDTAFMTQIYVQAKERMFGLLPKVEYVDITWTSSLDSSQRLERLQK